MPLRVNGELVSDSVLAREAESVRQRLESVAEVQRSEWGLDRDGIRARAIRWARENVIEQTLLRQAALAEPSAVDRATVDERFGMAVKRAGGAEKLAEAGVDESALREDLERQIKVERFVAKLTGRVKAPRMKELARNYRANKDRFKSEELVRASHIVKHVDRQVSAEEAKAAAREIHASLGRGESFETIADTRSDCPGQGGDLGYFPRGKMVKEFEDVAFGLPVGGISGVFRTVFGFHIVKVTDRKAAGVRPFAEVRDRIARELTEERRTKVLEQFLDSIRERATIDTVESAQA